MKNAHIAFVSTPIASCVNPTLPLVATLVRRGYRVTYATCDPFAPRVSQSGADVVTFGREALTVKVLSESAHCKLGLAALARIGELFGDSQPDMLIYDAVSLAGRVLAGRWNIPVAQTSSNFAFHRRYIDEQIPDPKFRQVVLGDSERADRFLRENGVASEGFVFHRERLNIYFIPKGIEPSAAALDSTCLHAGRCAGEQLGFGAWRRPAHDDKPLVLIAPSRSYVQGVDYYRMCIQALAPLGWRLVLSVDDDDDATSLSPLPERVEIVQRTSHTRILPYASLIVGMGGTAASAEAAYHGVPWLITSCGVRELEWVADNLARLGLGVHLRQSETNADSVRASAVRILSDAQLIDRVQRLRRAVLQEPGAEEAANKIEDCLHAGQGT